MSGKFKNDAYKWGGAGIVMIVIIVLIWLYNGTNMWTAAATVLLGLGALLTLYHAYLQWTNPDTPVWMLASKTAALDRKAEELSTKVVHGRGAVSKKDSYDPAVWANGGEPTNEDSWSQGGEPRTDNVDGGGLVGDAAKWAAKNIDTGTAKNLVSSVGLDATSIMRTAITSVEKFNPKVTDFLNKARDGIHNIQSLTSQLDDLVKQDSTGKLGPIVEKFRGNIELLEHLDKMLP